MGPEKLTVFRKISIPDLLPGFTKADKIQQLWVKFYQIHVSLHKDKFSEAEICDIEQRSKDWVRSFTSVYHTRHVTPYMHALAMHVPEFLRKYGSLTQFTQQGMEKLNDCTTIAYARSTNHKGSEALKQLLEKRNRVEYLEDKGHVRTPRTLTCSLCHKSGHNRRSCHKQVVQSQEQVEHEAGARGADRNDDIQSSPLEETPVELFSVTQT